MCEDDFYSKTGVCIGCDAGLCKNFFHVTWSGVKIVHGPSIFFLCPCDFLLLRVENCTYKSKQHDSKKLNCSNRALGDEWLKS